MAKQSITGIGGVLIRAKDPEGNKIEFLQP